MLVDYSDYRPSMSQLKDAGVTAVGRYIGWDGQPGFANTGKNITPAELGGLHAAGIAVWLCFEYGAAEASSGYEQGRADAQLAAKQVQALGLPHDRTVYFACDWDVPDYAPNNPAPRPKLGKVADYFQAIKDQHPPFTVGIYGGYWPVSRALSAGLVDHAWQTDAWSGSNVDKRISLHQLIPQVLGGQADQNVALVADFGQHPCPATPQQTTKVVLTSSVADGKESIHGIVAANPHNAVSTVIRLTVENSKDGAFHGGMGIYVDAGDWSSPLPQGVELYYYKEVTVEVG